LNKLENDYDQVIMDKKMSLSKQKLDFEKEIAEITKKFTSIIRENENKNFIKQNELKSENGNVQQANIDYMKNIELSNHNIDILKNELEL
jgi:5-methylcytosine-specific restriction endonuclease McrBC regulatory subunit McrC